MKSEQDYFNSLLLGDKIALTHLLHTYHNYLTVVGLRYLSDRQRVEDVIHDVFADLWNSKKEIELQTSVKSFLRGAVVNKCLAIIRKENRITLVEEHSKELVNKEATPDQVLDRDMLQETVNEIIATLPGKCREVFKLSRIKGLSHKEIADQLGISKKTIENHMTRALKTLRVELKRKEFLIPIFILLKLELWVGAMAYL